MTWRIAGGARTPVGQAKGLLGRVPPMTLAAQVCEETLARTGTRPGQVGRLVFFCTTPDSLPPFAARLLARRIGLNPETPALMLTEDDVAPFIALTLSGQLEGPLMLAGVSSASSLLGQTSGGYASVDRTRFNPDTGNLITDDAEALAEQCGLTRSALDQAALASSQAAHKAIKKGLWTRDMMPVLPPPDYEGFVHQDQALQRETTAESLRALKPLRPGPGGLITFGHLALPGDGACCVLLAPAGSGGPDKAGTLVSQAGVWGETEKTGGAAFAVTQVMAASGLAPRDVSQLDLVEKSAAHRLALVDALDPCWAPKLNKAGGDIAVGHVGAASTLWHLLALRHCLADGQAALLAASSAGLCGACLIRQEGAP